MAFDLGDYIEVKDRIAAFRDLYPDGRLTSDIVPTGHEGFVAVKAYAYRTPDDPMPGTGLAWEPVPGKTPYTKDSELQNAETSAWGRALIGALIADASGGVASANEVRNRIVEPEPPALTAADVRLKAVKDAAWHATDPTLDKDTRIAEAKATVDQVLESWGGPPKTKKQVEEIIGYIESLTNKETE